VTRAQYCAEADLGNADIEMGLRLANGEREFYSFYDWCLNPLQTVQHLIKRLEDEVYRYDALTAPWQREESRINLYLLISAVYCATDDYLGYRPWDLAPVARRLAPIRGLVLLIQDCLNVPYLLNRLRRRHVVQRWRQGLTNCVDCICDILLSGADEAPALWSNLRSGIKALIGVTLPTSLLEWRASIPEAFRCQDLSHHDVLCLAERYIASEQTGTGPILVVGPRTAGAYFAPLVSAFLGARQFPVAAWTTVRPKIGVSRAEKRRLRRLISRSDRLLVVDDYPNTGNTLTKTAALLEGLGAHNENITILAPDHPAQLDWKLGLQPMLTITLPCSEIYKRKLLRHRRAMGALLRELFLDQGWDDAQLQESPTINSLNARLSLHGSDTFETRLKWVFEVRIERYGRPPVIKHVLAKSVGWGWLGYHGYIAADRLADFVPALIGLRQGLLFTEWIGPLNPGVQLPSTRSVAAVVPSYVATRAARLPLSVDPCFASLGGRRTGWDTLLRVLCRPYGRMLGPLWVQVLKEELKTYVSSRLTFPDGGMGLENWVADKSALYKVDFEHHNFGGVQQDMVDPLYDLACAIYELDLSEAEERLMLDAYVRESGDETANRRILLSKLLCGIVTMQTAAYCIGRWASHPRQEEWNRRYNTARNFLTFQMSRFSASRLGGSSPAKWTPRLFFLDVDGVFDSEYFGPLFQHTTPSGLLALSILRSHGYSVVLNTGRSIEHVRSYCRSYGLPGGIAEYGSVFVDNIRNIELPLIDDDTRIQLARCRELIQKTPDVFTDFGYKLSIRLYRYQGTTTRGLQVSELNELLDASGFDRLKFISRDADSYIVQKNVDKGSAIAAVKQLITGIVGPVAAMGDSVQDIEMFQQADIAYVPANFPKAPRKLLRGTKYRLISQPRQKGLLAAVRDLTGDYSQVASIHADQLYGTRDCDGLIDAVLHAAERPRYARLLNLAHRQILIMRHS
jgi:hydroxymethylpyrimidine pyrophosphatase-like HAD family hydrolase